MTKKEKKEKKREIIGTMLNNSVFLLVCLYSDLTADRLITYKTLLKKDNINFKFVKNTLVKKQGLFVNKGATLIFSFENYQQLKKIKALFSQIKNLQFLYLATQKKIYTNYKITKLLNTQLITNQLRNPLFYFYTIMLQIN